MATSLNRDDIIAGLRDLIAELRSAEEDWDQSWLNFEVTSADAVPTLGRAVEWEAIYDREGIVIEVASKEALLAMKLRANRPGRDTRDIRLLMGLCGVDKCEEAEALYEEFYPGDALSDRAIHMVDGILADGAPPAPEALPPLVL